jgi:Peptidase M15
MDDLIKLPGITQPQQLTSPIYSGSHFTWGEATKNGTRLPCQTNFGGILIPAAQITSNIVKLAHKLDEIRELFGDNPVTITSWYRDPVTNRDVGGVRNSQHLLGWAADIQIEGLSPNDVAAKLQETWAGGLGDSSAFTHVDLRQLMGWSSARWDYGFA